MSILRVNKIAAPIIEEEYTGSVHLDAGYDKLIVNGLADFDGQFTIEGWYLASAFESVPTYFGNWNTATGILLRGTTSLTLFEGGDSSILTVSNANVNETGRWYHIALTRDGSNTIRLFKDGVVIGSVVHSDTIDNQTRKFTIGAEKPGTSGSDVWNGHISNFRIVQGNALYTDNFEVPTRELEVVDGTVVLCCQSSTSVTEEASGETTITIDTEGGNPTAQEANPGLLRKTNIYSTTSENTGSVYFDGSGDDLQLPDSADWDFGTDPFTIEFYVYPNVLSGTRPLLSVRQAGSGGWGIYFASNVVTFYSSSGSVFNYSTSSNSFATTNVWRHVAVTRVGNTFTTYIDGISKGTDTSSNSIDNSANDVLTIGRVWPSGMTAFDGFISNVRIVKGKALYTSNFTPPTTELEVTPETVLVACYDGENIFAEKTGKIIAAYGDRLSSPTPTATDSPIGITTNYPPVTRSVDATAGPVLQGNLEYNSQNFLVLPKGTTEQRGGDRGLFGGGYDTGSTRTQTIEYINISTSGIALNFGDLIEQHTDSTGNVASSTRGLFGGGTNYPPTTTSDTIEHITMSSTGNGVDFGNLSAGRRRLGSLSNKTRGIFGPGEGDPSNTSQIDFVTIATLGNASDFGDMDRTTEPNEFYATLSSPTRGIFAGGERFDGTVINIIDYITISSLGDAQNFGDLLAARRFVQGCSSQTRGIIAGGTTPSAYDNVIQYITISTLGDAQDFGDLSTSTVRDPHMTSNSIRGVFAGGEGSPALINTIEYVVITSTGNAKDFGDLLDSRRSGPSASNSHGGLG